MAWSVNVELAAPIGAMLQPILPPCGNGVAGGLASTAKPASPPGNEPPLEPAVDCIPAPLAAEPLVASMPDAAIAPEPSEREPLSVASSPLDGPPDRPIAPLASAPDPPVAPEPGEADPLAVPAPALPGEPAPPALEALPLWLTG